MAQFETWDRETLNQFARDASEKLLSAHAEIGRLKKAVEDWHDRAVTAERHIESLQNRYAQATAEAEAYRAELDRLRDVVSEIDASLIDALLDA